MDFVDESRLVAEESESAGHVSDKKATRHSNANPAQPIGRIVESEIIGRNSQVGV